MPTLNQQLILAHRSFAELAAQLAALGWRRLPDPTAPAPLIAGEPELAEWRRRDADGSDARLIYTFAPATDLRALLAELPRDADRSYAGELERHLPLLREPDIRALLEADPSDSRSVLRGIQAAALLRAPGLVAPLNQLLGSSNRTIAREARAALAALLEQAAHDAAAVLQQIERHTAGAPAQSFSSALFAALDDTRQRRQALRWIMRQHQQASPEIEAILAAALADDDWELRATAMLAAGRLGARRLASAVRGVELPSGHQQGVDADDRRILAALRSAALRLLAGEPPPPASAAPPPDRAALEQHIMRCAAGAPVRHHDRVFLLAYSLTTPFELPAGPEAQPPQLPGLDACDGGYWLEELVLTWIPPVAAWLGDDLAQAQIANPIRRISSAGYFIARRPLLDTHRQPLLLGWEEAGARCQQLTAAHGLRVRLPSADEWELAMRGLDGRRFPWGNALSRQALGQPSPWGVELPVGVCAQWSTSGDATPVVCGDRDQLRCSMRKPALGQPAALRIVVDAAQE